MVPPFTLWMGGWVGAGKVVRAEQGPHYREGGEGRRVSSSRSGRKLKLKLPLEPQAQGCLSLVEPQREEAGVHNPVDFHAMASGIG